ncbi:MAG: histidine--tRNA ligase [Candidatus Omnitrophica bacterium]|nr:histidine--tRNA ligase [Candidatus Omnitrophota bacterium]
MDDILTPEIELWQWVEKKMRIYFEAAGFKEIRTPLLEPTELFARSIGETSDIVHKEMYTLEDRGGRSMTLRPEMTASVARSVIEKSLLRNAKTLALYYCGPMFRAERPQAGRKRQFHQIGAEIINESGLQADLVIIRALYGFLKYLGIAEPKLKLNDLTRINGPESEEIRGKLKSYFEGHKDKLDKDSLYRLDKNVLRIFDSKDPGCQDILEKAPWDEIAPLSDDFKVLMQALAEENVPFEINRRLVRGLDYYTGVVFEISLAGLGAQDAVAGGGRYDGLYQELGGPKAPCTGFSIGFERLLMGLEGCGVDVLGEINRRKVYVAQLDEDKMIRQAAQKLALALRERDFSVEQGPVNSNMNHHFKKVNQTGAQWVVILGPDEIRHQECAIKNLNKREQKNIRLDEAAGYLEGEVLL